MATAALISMIPPATAPAFLDQHGWGEADILPLAGDASFRRYFRVVAPGRTAVLMDAPPDKEDSGPFLAIGAQLDALGFSVPRPLAVDLGQGLILLEDFGDTRIAQLLEREPARERAVYETAVDILAALHRTPAADVPAYDEAVLRREVGLFPEWYVPALGLVTGEGFEAVWAAVWGDVLAETARRPVLVLRDYHAENLMLLPDRQGLRGLGLLDFQDGLAGHPAYDLVSLLQDARRDVSPELEQVMIDRYVGVAGIADAAAFRAAYEVLGAQRNAKILGIFTRLWRRDGKPHYLRHQPRVWGYLERNLAHPALVPVRQWFDANIAVSARAAAWKDRV